MQFDNLGMKEGRIYSEHDCLKRRRILAQNRRFMAAFFLTASILACISIVLIFRVNSVEKIFSAGLGFTLGILVCGYIHTSGIRLEENSAQEGKQRVRRWMIPTIIGGLVLARLVIRSLNAETQDIINIFVFSWIAVFALYAAFLMWRYK